jgi:hypothetical protein
LFDDLTVENEEPHAGKLLFKFEYDPTVNEDAIAVLW